MVDDALMTPIQALIDQVRTTMKWSYRDISANAGELNGRPRLPASTVQKIAQGPLRRSPNSKTVVALAAGLRVPVGVVTAAIGETLGFREESPGGRGFSLAHALAERIDLLSDDGERGLILQVAERLVSAAEANVASRELEQRAMNVDKDAAAFGAAAARLLDLAEEADDGAVAGMADALRRLREIAARESGDVASDSNGASAD